MKLTVEEEMHDNYPANKSWISFLRYYPPRHTDIGSGYVWNRQFIYAFKDGNNMPAVDNLFILEINKRKQAKPAANFWLCAIPASTAVKTQKRYQAFCQRVAAATSVNNGYTMLQCKHDREELHKSNRDYAKMLASISFSSINGRNILLVDDIATRGMSFRMIANALTALGASSVHGIMLSKTHNPGYDNETNSVGNSGVLGFLEPLDSLPF